MLRKMMMAALATVAFGVLAPSDALARGGFGGGGGHGGGFGGFHGGGGGWHGGGVAAFRGAPMGGGVAFRQAAIVGGPHFVGGVHPGFVGGMHPGFHPGFRRRAFFAGAVAGGLYAPYGYYDDYDPYYAYPDQVYYDGGYGETGCTLMRQRVHTRYGWRYRNIQVCQ